MTNGHTQLINHMDKELHRKYINDDLTQEELERFRKMLAEEPDETLGREMETEGEKVTCVLPPDVRERETAVKRRIDAAIDAFGQQMPRDGEAKGEERRPRMVFLFRKAIRYAAVMLLPILAFAAWHYYTAVGNIPKGEIAFSAPTSSTAEAVLPDGTHVTLSHDSRLSYHLATFNGRKRDVTFSGEGWFEVAHCAGSPFTVKINNLKVTVLGTRFNIAARRQSAFAEVALEEGSVKLSTTNSSEEAILKPGEKAQFNFASGRFLIIRNVDFKNVKSWTHREMRFNDEPFDAVIERIEAEYGIDVIMRNPRTAPSRFTGVLPTDNLDECLKILRLSYALRCQKSGRRVVLSFK